MLDSRYCSGVDGEAPRSRLVQAKGRVLVKGAWMSNPSLGHAARAAQLHVRHSRRLSTMADALDNHFLATIEREFPRRAEFHVRPENDDNCIYVDWQLGTDQARPNKIKICISRAAVDDYTDGSEINRQHADARLRNTVAALLHVFNPDHNVATHEPVPTEQWTIATEMLNS